MPEPARRSCCPDRALRFAGAAAPGSRYRRSAPLTPPPLGVTAGIASRRPTVGGRRRPPADRPPGAIGCNLSSRAPETAESTRLRPSMIGPPILCRPPSGPPPARPPRNGHRTGAADPGPPAVAGHSGVGGTRSGRGVLRLGERRAVLARWRRKPGTATVVDAENDLPRPRSWPTATVLGLHCGLVRVGRTDLCIRMPGYRPGGAGHVDPGLRGRPGRADLRWRAPVRSSSADRCSPGSPSRPVPGLAAGRPVGRPPGRSNRPSPAALVARRLLRSLADRCSSRGSRHAVAKDLSS